MTTPGYLVHWPGRLPGSSYPLSWANGPIAIPGSTSFTSRAGNDPCICSRIGVAGGGARHPAWRQLLADALVVPLYPAGAGWLTARGAALIAAQAIGMAGARRPDRSEAKEEAVIGASQQAEASYRRFRSAAVQ